MVTKEKNGLRAIYDNAREFYNPIVTLWKSEALTQAEYLAFMRTYSYVPDSEVPMKFHTYIKDLQERINRSARLVRNSKKGFVTI